jgi:hypothetical protein
MKRITVLLAGLLLATAASADGHRNRIDYAAYATGEPLREIKFFQLYNWQRSSDKAVVLWTKPSEAYYLTLAHTCDELRSGRVVVQVGGVAGVPGMLRVNDDLLVGQMKCRVSGIQAMDLQAMKQDRKKA